VSDVSNEDENVRNKSCVSCSWTLENDTDKRAALHRSRPPADQSGKRVRDKLDGEVVEHARLVTDIIARMSRRCCAENGPVEFTLNGPTQNSSSLTTPCIYTHCT